MGPKNSTPAQDTEEKITISHPIFSVSKISKKPQSAQNQDQDYIDEQIQTQVRLPNKKQFDLWCNSLTEVPQNDALMLPISYSYKQQGMCGTGGVAEIIFQNFPYILSDEIINRQSLSQKLFQESQLWYLIYTLLSSSEYYHQRDMKVGDIRPDNIFINQDGQVKVACIHSWPGQQTNYAKSFFQKQPTYLSPQQTKDYKFGKMQEGGSKPLSQTFSIGLTCLDAAILGQSKSLYSKGFQLDYKKLQKKLKELNDFGGYSQLLVTTIKNMCEVDTEFRSSAQDLYKWLQPFQDQIVNLEDFQPSDLPEKMLKSLVRDKDQRKENLVSGQVVGPAVGNMPNNSNFGYSNPTQYHQNTYTSNNNTYSHNPNSSAPYYPQPQSQSHYKPQTTTFTSNSQPLNSQPQGYQPQAPPSYTSSSTYTFQKNSSTSGVNNQPAPGGSSSLGYQSQPPQPPSSILPPSTSYTSASNNNQFAYRSVSPTPIIDGNSNNPSQPAYTSSTTTNQQYQNTSPYQPQPQTSYQQSSYQHTNYNNNNAGGSTSAATNNNNDAQTTLDRINQQLEESRKMFQ